MGRVAAAGGGAVTVAAPAASTRDYDASWRGRLPEGKRLQAGHVRSYLIDIGPGPAPFLHGRARVHRLDGLRPSRG